MSKPLIVFLQFTGMCVILFGFMPIVEGNIKLLVVGLVLVIIGGIGYRKSN